MASHGRIHRATQEFLDLYRGAKIPSREELSANPITPEEVLQHNKASDCWVSHRGIVYNLTPYLEHHPAGVAPIEDYYGYDITAVTAAVHGFVQVEQIIAPLAIGVLKGEPRVPPEKKLKVETGVLRRRY